MPEHTGCTVCGCTDTPLPTTGSNTICLACGHKTVGPVGDAYDHGIGEGDWL